MRIEPLVQQHVFDVTDWVPDAEFGIFPQGARAKDAIFSPQIPGLDQVRPETRYLFKRSKRSYPDQFWGEVVAYRVGCLMGLKVPPAFCAVNRDREHVGALIEWFYGKNEILTHGGDLMTRVRPGYDRGKGTQHNLEDISTLMTAAERGGRFAENWRSWWADALLFDALIGNTDRHQDNWGLIRDPTAGKHRQLRLAPLFDNGTSLGHERFVERVRGWTDAQLNDYISKGTHHVKWVVDVEPVPEINKHLELLQTVWATWQGTLDLARARLSFSEENLRECYVDLCHLAAPTPFSEGRCAFISRLLTRRFEILKTAVA